jgi:hypothetical protein
MVVIDDGLHRQWLSLIVTFNMWNYLNCIFIYLEKNYLEETALEQLKILMTAHYT